MKYFDPVFGSAELIVGSVHYILDLTWSKSGFAAVNKKKKVRLTE
jgi:hypothetical protein